MGIQDSGKISANIGIGRKERIKSFASGRFNGNMTAAINAAIDAMIEDEARERASIPSYIIEAISYINLILNTGTPEQDWALLQQEVSKIWKSLQS